MDFHSDKCKILSFSQRYKNADLSLNGSRMKHVDSIVDLGITVNSSLCWNKHFDLSIAKATIVFNFFNCSVPIGVYVSRRIFFIQNDCVGFFGVRFACVLIFNRGIAKVGKVLTSLSQMGSEL